MNHLIKNYGSSTRQTLLQILVARENGEQPDGTLRDFKRRLAFGLQRTYGLSRTQSKLRVAQYVERVTNEFQALAEEEIAA